MLRGPLLCLFLAQCSALHVRYTAQKQNVESNSVASLQQAVGAEYKKQMPVPGGMCINKPGFKNKFVIHATCDNWSLLDRKEPEQTYIDTVKLGSKYWLDCPGKTLRVQPGVRFMDVAPKLRKVGCSLVAIAYLPQTIIGALSTSSHGLWDNMDDMVISMNVVNGMGVVKTVTPKSEDWRAWKDSLGLMGVITEATFKLTGKRNMNIPIAKIYNSWSEFAPAFLKASPYSAAPISFAWEGWANPHRAAMVEITPTDVAENCDPIPGYDLCFADNVGVQMFSMLVGKDMASQETFKWYDTLKQPEIRAFDDVALFGSLGSFGSPKDVLKNPTCGIDKTMGYIGGMHPIMMNNSYFVKTVIGVPLPEGANFPFISSLVSITVEATYLEKAINTLTQNFKDFGTPGMAFLRKVHKAYEPPGFLSQFAANVDMVTMEVLSAAPFEYQFGQSTNVSYGDSTILMQLQTAAMNFAATMAGMGIKVGFHRGKFGPPPMLTPGTNLKEFMKYKLMNDPCEMFTNAPWENIKSNAVFVEKWQPAGRQVQG